MCSEKTVIKPAYHQGPPSEILAQNAYLPVQRKMSHAVCLDDFGYSSLPIAKLAAFKPATLNYKFNLLLCSSLECSLEHISQ